MSAVLEMTGITKSFPGVVALRDVSFAVQQGETFCIMGENGAGKSTLMKILSGAYPWHSYQGAIRIEGAQKFFNSPRDAEAAGIGMIYQEISPFLDLNVAENIFMGHFPVTRFGKVLQDQLYQNTVQLLTKVGLAIDPRTRVRRLSISQQQMLSIAKALARKSVLLILDEPTSALTQKEARFLFEIIQDLKQRGISSIYISHKLDEVLEIADRFLVLRDGEVQGLLDKQNIDKAELVRLMLGKSLAAFKRKPLEQKTEIIFETRHLSIPHPNLPGRHVLEDISFNLRRGEILGFAGLVGSGRSELVNSIVGFKQPYTKGELFLFGKKLRVRSPVDAKRYGITLIGEDRRANGFVPTMNIMENITLAALKSFCRISIVNKASERRTAVEFVNRLNIKAKSIQTKALSLSGGNQQKVVISKWLSTNPKILILDEPTRGIDIGTKHEIYKLIETLAAQGMGIILISSELQELLNLCDRFIVLRNGAIAREFSTPDISEEQLYLAMNGLLEKTPQ